MRESPMKKLLIFLLVLLISCSPKQNNDRCLPATAKQLDFINYAVSSLQASNYIEAGWAVKSNEFKNVYMVATLIYGPSIEDGTGPAVFSVAGDPDSPDGWMAVDSFATNFTNLPDAKKTDAEITLSTD